MLTTDYTEFMHQDENELIAEFPAFDPFDASMSGRDKREIADYYESPIAWCRASDVNRLIVEGEDSADAYPCDYLRGWGMV